LKSAKDRMDIISAYQQLGSYRGAADQCGTTHRTVKKIVDKFEADQAGVPPQPRAERVHNYDVVADLVAEGARREVSGSDLGQAAAADRLCGRLRGFGSQFPAFGRRGEIVVAQG